MKTGLLTMHVKVFASSVEAGGGGGKRQAKNKDMANQFLLGENYY